jgi:hypothetical protein
MSDKIEYSRLLQKRSTVAGVIPTVTSATTLNEFSTTDVFEGEIMVNTTDQTAFIRLGNEIKEFDLMPHNTEDYDFCSTGIQTSTISACTTTIDIGKTGTTSLDTVRINANTGLETRTISFDSGASVWEFVELEIGSWNMQTTATLSVAHGLSATEWKTVRNYQAIVRNDADTQYFGLYTQIGSQGVSYFDSVNFNLERDTGGEFDNPNFNNGANRGWISYWYQPDPII